VKNARIALHVTPRSARDELAGWRGGELLVRVTAAPDGGKATAAACRVVATALGVPKTGVKIVRGHSSRHKQIEVEGVSEADVRALLGMSEEPLF
jgi:uncharacterized protein